MTRKEMQHTHLVLSTGLREDLNALQITASNVQVVAWVPQVEILKSASLAVIHGGLGTVKECIYYGVPMIVLPISRDQPANAECIVHHKIGISRNIADLSEEQLFHDILHVLQSADIRENLIAMQNIFHNKETESPGSAIIEEMLLLNEVNT